MALNMDRVAEICSQVCKAEAPKFRADPGEALGQVCIKVIENEKKLLKPLDNPDAWVWKTAWREARRAFKELQYQMIEYDERIHSLRATKSQPRDVLDLLVRREEQQHCEEQLERLQAEFDRVPDDQQVAFLVVTGVLQS
jgi:DNA-directed RNA polymerase specialized sigma24 family protein